MGFGFIPSMPHTAHGTSEHPLVAALRTQLAANAEARARIEKEQAYLEKALADAIAFYAEPDAAPNVPVHARSRAIDRAASRAVTNERIRSAMEHAFPSTHGVLFGPAPGGPTETVLAIVGERPGIKIDELLDAATHRVVSGATDKRGNLAETVRMLRNKGRVQRSDDGGHFLAK